MHRWLDGNVCAGEDAGRIHFFLKVVDELF